MSGHDLADQPLDISNQPPGCTMCGSFSHPRSECPVGRPGFRRLAEVKHSNPKDAVGVRKVSLSVLPWRVLYRVAIGMMEGAAKYGRHNYRAIGCRASVYFDATVGRHIGAWWEGEDVDQDSGEHHIDKAIASLIVMRDSMLQGNFVDDRPPAGRLDLPVLNERAADMLDRHADKAPRHYTIADTPTGAFACTTR